MCGDMEEGLDWNNPSRSSRRRVFKGCADDGGCIDVTAVQGFAYRFQHRHFNEGALRTKLIEPVIQREPLGGARPVIRSESTRKRKRITRDARDGTVKCLPGCRSVALPQPNRGNRTPCVSADLTRADVRHVLAGELPIELLEGLSFVAACQPHEPKQKVQA